MRRKTNSFKDYEFDIEKYQEEQENVMKDIDIEQPVYVKPVDTSVSAMVARGIVADNSQLVYGEDIPPMSKMSLMELHKMKQVYADKVQGLEADIKYQEEQYKKSLEKPVEPVNPVEPPKSE